jgi:ABC-type dipeptide/oligopeptide/nickel transport system permease component
LRRSTLIYIGQRLVLIVFTVLIVSGVVFTGMHSLPGDAFFSERIHNDNQERLLRHEYGLDKPLPVQYVDFLAGAAHFDFGESVINRGTRISTLVAHEAVISGEVGLAALFFTVVVGMVLGVIAAVRQNTWVDYLLTTTSVIGYSMPGFVIGSFLLIGLGVYLYRWTGGNVYYTVGWDGSFGHVDQVLVPAFALGFPYASIVARLTRASMLEVIRQDYIRTARAKGLVERVVVLRHGLRNALIPVTSVMPSLVLGILTGGVVIENLFGVPGLGKEFYTSILNRDYNIVIAVFTIYAALIGLANLAVDLGYTVIDPRIRY